MAAPPAPTAEQWAFAGRYTLKNSKACRYIWGQQVRSMMGTAVEGPDQAIVRFRVEVAPDGSLASLQTLWSTSPVAEKLARRAIASMPRRPATPTGRALVFDKTISFTPFATDGPPLYKDDCLPEPPAFGNPFAWDGKSPQVRAKPQPAEMPDPQAQLTASVVVVFELVAYGHVGDVRLVLRAMNSTCRQRRVADKRSLDIRCEA